MFQLQQMMGPMHPIGRSGTVEEIAKTVIFLASDDAGFITGIDMLIDGGYSCTGVADGMQLLQQMQQAPQK